VFPYPRISLAIFTALGPLPIIRVFISKSFTVKIAEFKGSGIEAPRSRADREASTVRNIICI